MQKKEKKESKESKRKEVAKKKPLKKDVKKSAGAKKKVLDVKKLPKEKKKASDMGELMSRFGSQVRTYRRGEIIEGTAVSVTHNQILVDVGAKSEGIIRGEELIDSEGSHKKIKEGDSILVSVVQAEDRMGYLVLSLKRAERERKWRDFERMHKDGSTFDVQVLEYTKGGLLVDAFGQRGFVPISHLEKGHFADFSKAMAPGSPAELRSTLGGLKGKYLKVKVIEVDKGLNRLVLSEKEAVSKDRKEADIKILEKFEVGEVLEGMVSGVVPFGLFVDVKKGKSSVDGLVHISEISWEKVNHPSSLYKVGDKVKVKVVDLDKDNGRLQLSIKALMKNPWESFAEKYPIGSKVKGVVTKVVPFGTFVKIKVDIDGEEYNIDGLIHISEMAGDLKLGDEVEAQITVCDPQRQKLGLSVRRISDLKIYK